MQDTVFGAVTESPAPSRPPAKFRGFIISGDVPVRPVRYARGMNVTRHFSDTRTDEGRVRFLLLSGRVTLMAEGQGWQSSSLHDTLDDAALSLATLPRVGGDLYRRALDDLDRRIALEQAA